MKLVRFFAGICSLCVTVYASKEGPPSGGGGPPGGIGPYQPGVLPQGNLGALDSVDSSLGPIPAEESYGGPPPAPYGDVPPPPYGEEVPPAPYGGAPPVPYGGRPARPYHAPVPFLTKMKIINLPKLPKLKLPDMPDLSMLASLLQPKQKKKKVPVVPTSYGPPPMYGYIQAPPIEFRPLPDIAIYLPSDQQYYAPPSYVYSPPAPPSYDYSAPPTSYGHSAPPAPHPVAEPRPFSPSY